MLSRYFGVLHVLSVAGAAGCVPPGNSTPSDSGVVPTSSAAASPPKRPSVNVMILPFEDTFDRASTPKLAASAATPATPERADGGEAGTREPTADARAEAAADARAEAQDLGPNWSTTGGAAWRIEKGRLCGQGARNHGVWLNKTLPVNATIEFDAVSESPDGDLKAELWGDGQSAATSISYTNATSYLAILGGWKNTFHVLARINEHGDDRKQITVDKTSDDPRQKPVVQGQLYHFKVERSDGHTVRWSVDGLDMLTYDDPAPLTGHGHDHFGFNNWEVKVCFDNVKVTPGSAR